MRRFALLALLLVALAGLATACGGDDDDANAAAAEATTTMETTESADTTTMAEEMNIVETAVAAGQFETLVSLVEEAGLADELSGPGPLTVFAPTDDAFAAVPQETLDQLGQDPELLRTVLLYHVVEGEVPAADVPAEGAVPTLAGPDVQVTSADGTVTVNDATVVQADVMASNGIIHVIDTVLLPPS